MNSRAVLWVAVLATWAALSGMAQGSSDGRLFLRDQWMIQSSAKVHESGESISRGTFRPEGWLPATVPSTVAGSLVNDKVDGYADPFFGMNLRAMPGVAYTIGVNFSERAMPADSPFRVSWWYRKEFDLAIAPGQQAWLDLDGVNYRANVWLNGKLVANTNQIVGAYRVYDLNITRAATNGRNALAIEVFPPQVDSLAITWVDWNPSPPDKEMGLWRDVSVSLTGAVALRHPQIVSKVDKPALDWAHLTVSAEVRNTLDRELSTTIEGKIENISFSQPVRLGPGEIRKIIFDSTAFPQLNIEHPRLWWPTGMGAQELYDLNLDAKVDGAISDHETIRFGVREATSDLNEKGYRVFKINGRPVLIRGGGWAPDMFLRPSAEREIQELRYVKDMHLNAIRFEGKTESGRFLELCDREGIMVIAGWCCCDYWERWSRWKDGDYDIAAESLRSQIQRIRNHPCVITWWYGSDNPPNERAEKRYLEVLKELDWPNSAQASATAKKPKVGPPTGIRMTGPYEYVPPVYWYVDKHAGGAWSFNTETSPGPAVPPIESLRRILPPDHLWPIDNYWNYHCGGGAFKTLNIFTEALNKRLGAATNAEDYAQKAQAMCYDGERAMFEAYGRNKYSSTGVIQWMMNNAWPSMIWHLYDYFLRPGGGYFGAKKACEPLHIQYSYDDRSVVAVNSTYESIKGLKASAAIYNLDLTAKFSNETTFDLGADESRKLLTLPEPTGLTPTYFVRLEIKDAQGRVVSQNFYWLSTQPDTLGEPKEGSDWYYTPTRQFANLTALGTLPEAKVDVSFRAERAGAEEITRVSVENRGTSLAFLLRLKVNRGKGGEEVLPVIWDDNYFCLMPGEKREMNARCDASAFAGGSPSVEVSGWNVKRAEY
jgi:exo-1,4-beta-D-glucosaminidase